MKINYIIRSQINNALILCTTGEFMPEIFIGPGHDLSAKVYKTERAARRAHPSRIIETYIA